MKHSHLHNSRVQVIENVRKYYKESSSTIRILIRIACGLLIGALLGKVLHWFSELESVSLYLIGGTIIGGLIGSFWQVLAAFWRRFDSKEWRIVELEIETFGQKWKLASSDTQRRVAWTIFVEIVTRIATQSMADEDGDDGIALKSLYDLFQLTRKSIRDIAHTSVLPSRVEDIDTVETYSLAMLNQDLRPFLSKWHPIYDAWKKKNPDLPCSQWIEHIEFRSDLKNLQAKIRERAEGLGKIAGVLDINRFMRVTTNADIIP